MKNIILIGMPGAGKSTIGVLLAKSMLMDFADTDLIIQKKHSSALCKIIKERGINEFLKIENDVICHSEFHNCVVATGGSAVYGEEAMKKLKESGVAVYLKVEPQELEKRINNIHTRGIAMKDGTTIAELYAERAPLYEKYADITVNCTGLSPEECVDEITKKI
ncbi:MAG: shikimate kinase [Clostridia bacterium]|nr:shikimate kinase [Clostridia bacterium]